VGACVEALGEAAVGGRREQRRVDPDEDDQEEQDEGEYEDEDDEEPDSLDHETMLRLLPAYNKKHHIILVCKPVLGRHTAPCSECYQKLSRRHSDCAADEWYWSDACGGWDKFCDDCMAEKLGGVFYEDDGFDE
jgi:hypothetical protein